MLPKRIAFNLLVRKKFMFKLTSESPQHIHLNRCPSVPKHIILSASEFIQRTSEEGRVQQIHIYEFNQVTLILDKNREKGCFTDFPKMDREQLAAFIKQAHLLVTELSDGDFKIAANLRLLGGAPKTRKIHKAAEKGDVSLMEQILADKVPKKYDVDITNEKGETALHIVSRLGQAYIAQMLVAKGANVNFPVDSSTPLHLAVITGSIGVVDLLAKNRANFYLKNKEGESVLHLAAKHGHLELVRRFLYGGFNDLDSKNTSAMCPLALACSSKAKDKLAIIDMLLQYGADPIHIPLALADSFSKEIKNKIKFPLHVSSAAGNNGGVLKFLNSYSVDLQDINLNTPLHLACTNGHIAIIAPLAEKSQNLNLQNKMGDSPLIIACEKGNIDAAKILLAKGADVNIKNLAGNTTLYYAVTSGNRAFVELILMNNLREVDTKTNQGTALQIACRGGNGAIIDLLLDYGADPTRIDEKKSKDFSQDLKNKLKFPLHQCIKAGDVNRVRTMMQRGANDKLLDEEGNSSLHIAAMNGNGEIIALIAEKSTAINLANKEDATPLHIACSLGHLTAAKLLIEKGADIKRAKVKDNANLPLHLACKKKGNLEIVQLVAYDVNIKNRKGDTPLHIAAGAGCFDTVSYLLERGVAEIDGLNLEKETPLQCACKSNNLELIDLLIQRGADPKKMAPNFYDNLSADLKYRLSGNSQLHISCEKGKMDEVRILLEKGANTEGKNFNGNTPLHLACMNGNLAIIQMVAEKTTEVDAVNKAGETPLHIACSKGNADAVKILIAKESDVNKAKEDDFGNTSLISACGPNGNLALVKLLVEKGAQTSQSNKKGDTALHLAAMNNNAPIVEYLAPRCDIEAMNKTKETPLAKAASRGNMSVIDLLLLYGADPRKIPAPISDNMQPAVKDKLINTPLHAACKAGNLETVKQLLAKGAQVDLINLEGDTPLHYLAQQRDAAILSLLAPKSSRINQENQHGFTPLHRFCTHGNTAGAEILLNNLADVNKVSSSGSTPMHYACGTFASEELVKLLFAKGADLQAKDNQKNTCLHLAAKNGHLFLAEFFLKNGFKEIDALNNEGLTPLAEAALHKRVEIIDLLLKYKADRSKIKPDIFSSLPPDVQQRVLGNSPLHVACMQGNAEAVNALLEQGGADLANHDGNTPLHLACLHGHNEIISLVAGKSNQIDQLNQNGESALHIVCAKGNWQGALPLIRKGTNVHLGTAKSGDRPIHLACGKEGNLELVKLLEEQNGINEKNFNEDSALHFAAVWGHASIVAYLLSKGMQETKNREGKTPLTYACLNQHLPLIDRLRLNGADVEAGVAAFYQQFSDPVRQKLSESLMHIACREGDEEVVKELLEQNFKMDLQDQAGNTPLHMACINGNLKILASVAEKSRNSINLANKKGDSPLHLACLTGLASEGIDLLLKSGAQINKQKEDNLGNTPFILACGMGNLQVAMHLAQRGADIPFKNKKGLNALYYAVTGDHAPIAAFLLEKGVKEIDASLAVACSAGNGSLVDLLLQYGADPRTVALEKCAPEIQAKLSNSPLHAACKEGKIEEVRALIRKALTVDIPNQEGNTPLHLACMKGNAEMIQLVAEKSRNIDSLNKAGCTPLHIVCTTGLMEGIQLLVQRGANVNLPKGDEQGQSPLMLTCYAADLNVLKFLIGKGADINFKNKKGDTLLHLAVTWERTDIVDYLLGTSSCLIDSVNHMGETPLAAAALKNQIKVVNLMMKRADPGKILPSIIDRLSPDMRHLLNLNAPSIQPLTVKPVKPVAPGMLSEMCQTHDLDFIELAIRKGARPDGKTLTLACLTGNRLIVDAVIAVNAFPDEKTLPAACSTNNPEIVQRVLQRGARVTNEAREIALKTGNQAILNMLN